MLAGGAIVTSHDARREHVLRLLAEQTECPIVACVVLRNSAMNRAATRPTATHPAACAGLELPRWARIAAFGFSLTCAMSWVSFAAAEEATASSAVSRVKRASAEKQASSTDRKAAAEDKAAAQALFDQGRELMERGQPEAACALFEESETLDSGLGTRYHLADCYESIGKLASAHTLFLQIAAEAAARGQAKREEVARERAEAVQPRLSKLTIEVPHPQRGNLAIARDGKRVGRPQWGLPVPVDPGVHRVEASGPGLVSWSAEIEVSGEPGVSTVIVPPLAADHGESFFDSTSRKIGLGALGVGVGTLALGTIFAIQASSKNDESNRAGCSTNGCPNDQSLTLRRQALQAGNRATWATGVGVAGLGAAAVLFWVLPDHDDEGEQSEDVRVSSAVDTRGAALRVEGRF